MREKGRAKENDTAAAMASPAESPSIRRKLLPLYNAVGHLTRRIDQRIGKRFQENMNDVKLTRTQFAMLIIVTYAPGLEQAEIAQLAGYDAATAGMVISRLDTLGLIRRSRSKRSRRGWIVEPTEEGRAVVEKHASVLDALQTEILSPLKADDQLTLLRLLSKLVGVSNSYNIVAEGTAAKGAPKLDWLRRRKNVKAR